MSVTVVIPTIREDCAKRWIREWEDDLEGIRIIMVEDNPEPTFDVSGVEHYSWRDINADLGDDSWIIPRRTSACRSYGFLKALQGHDDIIWTMDDDCYPEDEIKGQYLGYLISILSTSVYEHPWWNTIGGTGLYPRGYPYDIRSSRKPVMLHHGLWSNVPDLDGITQLANPGFRMTPSKTYDPVPFGRFFPMCIMNVAFRKDMTPLMYMLLMGKDRDGTDWGYDRFDDIWAGLFVKKTIDHLGWACTSGTPSVHHSRASDPVKNAELEKLGMAVHERFWEHIRDAQLRGRTPGECYLELAGAVEAFGEPSPRDGYWKNLASAMRRWAILTT